MLHEAITQICLCFRHFPSRNRENIGNVTMKSSVYAYILRNDYSCVFRYYEVILYACHRTFVIVCHVNWKHIYTIPILKTVYMFNLNDVINGSDFIRKNRGLHYFWTGRMINIVIQILRIQWRHEWRQRYEKIKLEQVGQVQNNDSSLHRSVYIRIGILNSIFGNPSTLMTRFQSLTCLEFSMSTTRYCH